LLDRLLRNTRRSRYLQRAIVAACFGETDPALLIAPRTLWEVFKP
jgi:hypothetical protein